MHGEPLLNPHIYEILRLFRAILPKGQLMLTTNSVPLLKDFSNRVTALFEAGLNYLVCDAYGEYRQHVFLLIKEYVHQHPQIRYHDTFTENHWTVFEYHGCKEQAILFQDDLTLHRVTKKNVRKRMHNQAGDIDFYRASKYGFTPVTQPLRKTCVLPYRDFVIHYDGVVSLCCIGGYRRQGVIGKIPEQTPQDVWESEGFNAVRALLKRKARHLIVPCQTCDYFGGFRVGLTKDPFPNETLENLHLLYQLSIKDYQHYVYPKISDSDHHISSA